MKVLYISGRLNSPDGSSVHGRAFVSCVEKLGHEIRTYPVIVPLVIKPKQSSQNNGITKILKKFRVRNITSRLKKLNHRIENVLNLVEGLKTSIYEYIKLKKIIKEFNPDVIVYRQRSFSFAAIWSAKAFNIPCVIEMNALKSIELKLSSGKKSSPGKGSKGIIDFAVTYPLKRANRVFCVSSAIKEHLDVFLDPDNVSVIANGVDAEEFDRSRFDRIEIKEKMGLSDKIILGYVGSYQPWHGVTLSVDVLEKLLKVNSKFHLLLIGNGQEFSIIARDVERRGLEANVTQVDYVPHTEVPEYLAIFDIALMTYPIFDDFYFSPLKMYEYMAMQIPVVATDIGQIREVIEDNKTGALVGQSTAEEFCAAIKKITDDMDHLEAMGVEARRVAIEKHSWLSNASNVMLLCSELMNAKDKG